jgi:hypothetical protein
MILGTLNNLKAQQMTYAISYSKGFFAIESTNNVNTSDLSFLLPTCDCYAMQVLGDKIIIGTEKFQDFIVNQNVLLTKYQEMVTNEGKYDTTITYQINKTDPSKVDFYYYKTTISGTIPTGKFALSEGYYIVEIFKNKLLVKEFTISIQNSVITKL